jgi:hypothetical protein
LTSLEYWRRKRIHSICIGSKYSEC